MSNTWDRSPGTTLQTPLNYEPHLLQQSGMHGFRIIPPRIDRPYTSTWNQHDPNQPTSNKPSGDGDKKPAPLNIIRHQQHNHNNEPSHLPHKHASTLQLQANTTKCIHCFFVHMEWCGDGIDNTWFFWDSGERVMESNWGVEECTDGLEVWCSGNWVEYPMFQWCRC